MEENKTTNNKEKKVVKKSITKSTEKKNSKVVKNSKNISNKKQTNNKKNYYLFKMNTGYLNGLSIILIILSCLFFYLLYREKSILVLNDNLTLVIILYLPYLILHELLHSIAYVIYGASFSKITYGAHLEKGILCCLCKQNINKRNILHSLLYPFVIIGIITLAIGIIFNYPLLIILSLFNITGCSGDLLMYYHLSRLNNYQFSEFDDPIGFALYTTDDFSKLKMFGLEYVEKRPRLERTTDKKVTISKASIFILLAFYILTILTIFI